MAERTKKVVVHEHRAPTVDTARYLSELEKAAEARVLSRHVFHDNRLSGAVVEVVARPRTSMRELVVVFSLNGDEHLVRVGITEESLQVEDARQILAEQMALAITEKLLGAS